MLYRRCHRRVASARADLLTMRSGLPNGRTQGGSRLFAYAYHGSIEYIDWNTVLTACTPYKHPAGFARVWTVHNLYVKIKIVVTCRIIGEDLR